MFSSLILLKLDNFLEEKIKAKLSELIKQGVIDKDEADEFDEFYIGLRQLLPNISEEKTRQLFDMFDKDKDGKVSWEDCLDDANFNEYLEICLFLICHCIHSNANNIVYKQADI